MIIGIYNNVVILIDILIDVEKFLFSALKIKFKVETIILLVIKVFIIF